MMNRIKFEPQFDEGIDEDFSRIAVIGGGPSGSFFSYFLLDMAEKAGLSLQIDIYESRDFTVPGPAGCNMCGGIISESLVQTLAMEGIELPVGVVRRGIESYTLHMDVGRVQIRAPASEKRIGAIFRGVGPKGFRQVSGKGFDGYLMDLARKKGANLVEGRVDKIGWKAGLPEIHIKGGDSQSYHLLAVATGVNSPTLRLFTDMNRGYASPRTTKTYICEYYLGSAAIERNLGNSMHTFLLDIPRLEFAAIIPKGDHVTVCLLGKDIDTELVRTFLARREVKEIMPAGWQWEDSVCQCMPRMNIHGSKQPFMNRIVFIGDSGVCRLYKDGIGSAYQTAKAAASCTAFHGISKNHFKENMMPVYRKINADNSIGKFIFGAVSYVQKSAVLRRSVLRMVSREQDKGKMPARMSSILWDMFTGSAPYGEISLRILHPFFWCSLFSNFVMSLIFKKRKKNENRKTKFGIFRKSVRG